MEWLQKHCYYYEGCPVIIIYHSNCVTKYFNCVLSADAYLVCPAVRLHLIKQQKAMLLLDINLEIL